MQEQFSLKQYNSFGFDVNAKRFVEINTIPDLENSIKNGILTAKKHLILSDGNNVVINQEL